jgi:hypothetical protein
MVSKELRQPFLMENETVPKISWTSFAGSNLLCFAKCLSDLDDDVWMQLTDDLAIVFGH